MLDASERRHVLDYDSAVAMRYHGRRRAFCENVSKLGTGLSLLLGTAAFAALTVDWPETAKAAAGLVAAINGLNLAFGVADAGRRHGEIFRRWGKLRAELADAGPDDERALKRLEVKRAKIDAESPTQLEALSVLCENAEKEMRDEGPLYHVPWLNRVLADLFDLPGWQPKAAR
jgi:hypothetical protein